MIIRITWPQGTTLEIDEDTSSMSPDGVDTLLRQVHDLAVNVLAETVAAGLEGETAEAAAEVLAELEDGESRPEGT